SGAQRRPHVSLADPPQGVAGDRRRRGPNHPDADDAARRRVADAADVIQEVVLDRHAVRTRVFLGDDAGAALLDDVQLDHEIAGRETDRDAGAAESADLVRENLALIGAGRIERGPQQDADVVSLGGTLARLDDLVVPDPQSV